MTEIKIQKLPDTKLAEVQSKAPKRRQRYPFSKLTEVGLFFDVEDSGEVNDKDQSLKLLSVKTASQSWLRRNKKPWQLTVTHVTVKAKSMIRCARIA